MPTVKLQLPADLAYREVATRTVALVCKVATGSLDTKDSKYRAVFTNELVSAVGEAFNNVAIHGYPTEPGDVTLVMTITHEFVQVELRDDGSSFDPSEVAAPDLPSLPESGMGLYIIRSFVDLMEYESGPPNVLALTKYLRTG